MVGGVVYVSSLDKHLYAIELSSGAKWEDVQATKASPAVKGDRVYVGDLNGVFYCLNATDGKVVWKFEAEGEIDASANFHGDNIIFGSHDSNLYCLLPDGKKAWAVAVDGPINAATAVVGDRAFATGCSDGILHVIDVKQGKELGTIDLVGQSVSTAAVVGDRLYAAMVSNQVVAADLKTMKKLWTFEPASGPAVLRLARRVAGIRRCRQPRQEVYAWTQPPRGSGASRQQASGRVAGDRGQPGIRRLPLRGRPLLRPRPEDGQEDSGTRTRIARRRSVAVGPDCILVGTDRGWSTLGKK